MEEISKIIREAKPLYFARRRKRRAMAFSAALAVCVLIVKIPMLMQTTSPVYDAWSEQIYLTENGSPIEDLGLPVDEYGLLWVG